MKLLLLFAFSVYLAGIANACLICPPPPPTTATTSITSTTSTTTTTTTTTTAAPGRRKRSSNSNFCDVLARLIDKECPQHHACPIWQNLYEEQCKTFVAAN